MNNYKDKRILFYSLVRGVGSSTIAYQLSRALRIPLFQENKYDIGRHLKSVLDSNKYDVRFLLEHKKYDYDYGAIYDLEELRSDIVSSCTDIVILTNNAYLDILKTIATLKQLQEYKINKAQIHIVFNRLQNGSSNREKKYTEQSKKILLANTDIKNIKFSYIRTNLVYYRQIREGNFFMNNFFKKSKIADKLIVKYPKILEVEYPYHMELLFNKLYENKPYDFSNIEEYEEVINDFNEDIELSSKKIAEIIYASDYIKNSKVVVKDMFLLLYNLGVYEKNEKIEKKYF